MIAILRSFRLRVLRNRLARWRAAYAKAWALDCAHPYGPFGDDCIRAGRKVERLAAKLKA